MVGRQYPVVCAWPKPVSEIVAVEDPAAPQLRSSSLAQQVVAATFLARTEICSSECQTRRWQDGAVPSVGRGVLRRPQGAT